MNRIFLIFVFSLFTFGALGAFAQVKQQRVEPVYVAAKLLEMVEPESYPDVLSYYGYERDSTAVPGENRYSYQGSTVIWRDNLTEETDSIHELTFYTPQSISEIEAALIDNGYVKNDHPLVNKPALSDTRFERRLRFSDRSRVIILQSGSPNALHLLHKR